MTTNISAVILAGGAGSRLKGTMKPNLVIGHATIFSRILLTLHGLFDEIIVVTNTPREFMEFENIKITADQFHKAGPLGGIHAGMKASVRDAVFVFAGDMPFLNRELIIRQLESYLSDSMEILVPRINENTEPLHSIYSNKLLIKLEEYLEAGKSSAVRDFLKLTDVKYLDLAETAGIKNSFMNINSQADISAAEKLLESGLK